MGTARAPLRFAPPCSHDGDDDCTIYCSVQSCATSPSQFPGLAALSPSIPPGPSRPKSAPSWSAPKKDSDAANSTPSWKANYSCAIAASSLPGWCLCAGAPSPPPKRFRENLCRRPRPEPGPGLQQRGRLAPPQRRRSSRADPSSHQSRIRSSRRPAHPHLETGRLLRIHFRLQHLRRNQGPAHDRTRPARSRPALRLPGISPGRRASDRGGAQLPPNRRFPHISPRGPAAAQGAAASLLKPHISRADFPPPAALWVSTGSSWGRNLRRKSQR